MNIKLCELESLRKDVRAFVRAKAIPVVYRGRFSYSLALRLSIFYLHKQHDDLTSAADYLSRLCTKHFKNESRIDDVLAQLEAYYNSYVQTGGKAFRIKHLLNISLSGNHRLSGEIPRVDMGLKVPYVAWLFASSRSNWTSELRMPLLQYYMSRELACAEQDVAVGVYCFTDNTHTCVQYSECELNAARHELDQLLMSLDKITVS